MNLIRQNLEVFAGLGLVATDPGVALRFTPGYLLPRLRRTEPGVALQRELAFDLLYDQSRYRIRRYAWLTWRSPKT